MLLSKKIRIEVSAQEAEALEFMQGKCRGLYNWWIGKLRNGERWNLERAKKSLRESKVFDPDLRFVYGKLLAEVYFHLDKAMQAFFKRVAAGAEKPVLYPLLSSNVPGKRGQYCYPPHGRRT